MAQNNAIHEPLADARALVRIFSTLDDPEALAETFRAIRDVSCWWP